MQGLPHVSKLFCLSVGTTFFVMLGFTPDDDASRAGRAWLTVKRGSCSQTHPIHLARWLVLRHQEKSFLKEMVTSELGTRCIRPHIVHLVGFPKVVIIETHS